MTGNFIHPTQFQGIARWIVLCWLGVAVSCSLFRSAERQPEATPSTAPGTPPSSTSAANAADAYYPVFPEHLQYDTPLLPPNFFWHRLPNGLEIVVIKDSTLPIVTIELAVRNGAFTEDSSLDGLSHLYEHMFFKANKKYPSQEAFMDRVRELGIVFNGTTSKERVNYFFTLPAEYWKEGLSFMATAIQYPLFDSVEMKRENIVVAGEFQRLESNPLWFLIDRMNEYLWQEHKSRKNAIGRYEVILNATPAIMREIQHRYYYPNNSILVVAGAVNPDSVFTYSAKEFGSWQPSPFDIFTRYPIPRFPPIHHNVTFIEMHSLARVPAVLMAWQGPATVEDIHSTYAADVFFEILRMRTARLQKNLVDSGYAHHVDAYYLTQRFVGPIQLRMLPHPERINQAILKLLDEVNHWTDPDYITDEQIEQAKQRLIIDWRYMFEKPSELVHHFTFWWASTTPTYFTTYPDSIRAVTREAIQAFLNRYIAGRPWVLGLLIPPALRSVIDTIHVIRDTRYAHQYQWTISSNPAQDTIQHAEALEDILFLLRINPGRNAHIVLGTRNVPDEKLCIAVYQEFLEKHAQQFGISSKRWHITTDPNSSVFSVKLTSS